MANPALRAGVPELAQLWEPKLTAHLRPGLRPLAEMAGALCGMAMTGKQGGRRETFAEFTA